MQTTRRRAKRATSACASAASNAASAGASSGAGLGFFSRRRTIRHAGGEDVAQGRDVGGQVEQHPYAESLGHLGVGIGEHLGNRVPGRRQRHIGVAAPDHHDVVVGQNEALRAIGGEQRVERVAREPKMLRLAQIRGQA